MVGISVGGGAVTLSTGETVPFTTEAPRDLLQRVATGTPCVLTSDGALRVVPAHVLYVAVVAGVIRGGVHASSESPLAIAIPGWWAPRAVARVKDEFARQSIDVVLINDAEAVVSESRHQGHALTGAVAVVSLRAEQTSVVIVRDCSFQPTALLSPTRVHEEGGAHLDAAVLRHLLASLSELGDHIDKTDPQVIAGARVALAQSRALREELSITVTETVLPDIPGSGHRVRVVRGEIEEISRPWADAVIKTLRSAVDESAVPVDAVLLSGGLATMPLVSQRVSADLALETHVPEDPEAIAAVGAARLAESRSVPKARTKLSSWWQKRSRPLTIAPPKPRPARAAVTRGTETDLSEFLSSILEMQSQPKTPAADELTQPAAGAERLLATDDR